MSDRTSQSGLERAACWPGLWTDNRARANIQPNEVFPNYHCGWDGCKHISPFKLTELELHVQNAHLREVQETYCPFNGKCRRAAFELLVPCHGNVGMVFQRVDAYSRMSRARAG